MTDISKFTRDQLIAEAWHRGNLSYKMHSAQKKLDEIFKTSPGQLFVGNCSRQLGKTYWAAVKAVSQALKKPKSQIRYGSPFHTDLIEFIIPTFEKVMEDCPDNLKGKYRSSGTKFIFPNGSSIKLVGLDKNPNGLRGNALDLVVLDECGFCSNLDYIYKSILIPATTHRPNCKIIMISTPPSTPAHDFVDYCQKAEQEGAYCKFTIYDNPMINEETIQRLARESGGMHTTTWRREYLCEFVTDSDLAIIGEWDDKFVQEIERDDYYQYYHKYVCMDMGRKDHTTLGFGYYDFKKASLILEDEITMHGTTWTTETLKADLLAKEKDLWGGTKEDPFKPYRRIADNNNPHLILDLTSLHNVYFIETTKESLEAMVNEVRMFVGSGRLIIHPRCKQLIGCLKYGVWDKKRKEFARSKVYGHFDHLAGLIYLIRNLDQHTNPVPLMHGHVPHRTFTKGMETKLTNTEQNLKNIFTRGANGKGSNILGVRAGNRNRR